MPIGLIVAAALLGAPPGAASPAAAATRSAQPDCAAPPSDPGSPVVICAPKPEGYRIDPDVLQARREKKEALAGRKKPPESYKDHSCTVVGPAPCIGAPAVNLLGAAATAAEVAARVAEGKEVGSIFVTDPQTSEYQFYLAAKKRREEAAAKAAAATKKAAQATKDASAP